MHSDPGYPTGMIRLVGHHRVRPPPAMRQRSFAGHGGIRLKPPSCRSRRQPSLPAHGSDYEALCPDERLQRLACTRNDADYLHVTVESVARPLSRIIADSELYPSPCKLLPATAEPDCHLSLRESIPSVLLGRRCPANLSGKVREFMLWGAVGASGEGVQVLLSGPGPGSIRMP